MASPVTSEQDHSKALQTAQVLKGQAEKGCGGFGWTRPSDERVATD